MACELADALKRQYSSVTFEYAKLSALFRRCADWYDSIVNVERYYPSIFRVAYYGMKFPPQIRNKEFIFRGAPLEQIIDFSSRARAKFPGSVLLELKAEIGPEHTDQSETYFMSISKLTPCTRPEMKGLPPSSHVTDPLLPPGLKGWRTNNCLDTFSYRRPYNKRKQQGLKKSANSVKFNHTDI
jgi:dedicator of cytokinesis protein 3